MEESSNGVKKNIGTPGLIIIRVSTTAKVGKLTNGLGLVPLPSMVGFCFLWVRIAAR